MKKIVFMTKPLPGETIAQFKLRVKNLIINKDIANTVNHTLDSGLSDKDLRSIQHNFHKLITEASDRSWDKPTTERFLKQNVENFPKITESLLNADEPSWFAVEGMYGGFKYELRKIDDKPVLLVDSWNRVIGGSGYTHEITTNTIKLVGTFDI
jgi:hypothetical protein